MTTNNVPTDAEILEWAGQEQFFLFCSPDEVLDIVKSALQRYGQPAVPADEWLDRLAHLLGRYGLPPEHLEPVLAHARGRIEPAMPADAEDAERYRLLRRGQHWSVVDGIGDTLRADALDAAIDSRRRIEGES